MRKILLAIILTTLAACSQAPTPFVSKEVFPLGYSSMDDAARAGIKAAVASSAEFERGGGILQGGDGKFYWTNPVGGKDTGEVKFEVQFQKQNFKLVGLYHTHPKECELCGTDATEFFSEPDVTTAKNLHIISYIGILKIHTVARFNPEHDPTMMVESGKDDGTSELVSVGEQIGFF